MKQFVFLLLFISLNFGQPEAQASITCSDFFRPVQNMQKFLQMRWRSVLQPKSFKNFDWQYFEAQKAEYLKLLEQGKGASISRETDKLEDSLALIEAISQKSHLSMVRVGQDWTEYSNKELRSILRQIKKFRQNKLMREAQLKKLGAAIYSLNYSEEASAYQTLLRMDDEVLVKFLNKRFEQEVIDYGLIEFIKGQQQLKHELWITKLKDFFKKPQVQIPLDLLLNGSAWVKGSPALFFSKWNFLKISAEDIARASFYGVPHEMQRLLKIYGKGAKAESIQHALSKVLKIISLPALVGIGVYKYKQDQKEAEEQAGEVMDAMIDALEQQQEEIEKQVEEMSGTSSGLSLKEQWFQEWIDDYTKENGHAPDPESEEYQKALKIYGIEK